MEYWIKSHVDVFITHFGIIRQGIRDTVPWPGLLGVFLRMAKSQHGFQKQQREKKKQQRIKEKQQRMEERKLDKGAGQGPEIDWSSAPVNSTLNKEDEQKKAEVRGDTDPAARGDE